MFLPQPHESQLLWSNAINHISSRSSSLHYLQTHRLFLSIPWGCSTWPTMTLHHCSSRFQCLLGTPNILALSFTAFSPTIIWSSTPPQLPSLLYAVLTNDCTSSTGSMSSIPFSDLYLLSFWLTIPLVPQTNTNESHLCFFYPSPP